MNEDKISPQSNTNSDEPDFSAPEKVFDITSDLNITPVNDFETEKEADKPIENFAQKMASETRATKIYSETKNTVETASTQVKQNIISKPTDQKIQAKPKDFSVFVKPQPNIKTDSNRVISPLPIPQKPTKESTETTTKPTQIFSPQIQSNSFPKKDSYKEYISDFSPTKDTQMQPNPENTVPEKIIVPTTEPILEAKEGTKTENVLKQLRTYEGDVADLLSRRKTSSSSIAIAEGVRSTGTMSIGSAPTPQQQTEIEQDTGSGTGKKILLVLISLIFIGGGVIGAYYLYMKSAIAPKTPATPIVQVQKLQSLIKSDSQVSISIDNASQTEIHLKIQNEVSKDQVPNTIKEIVLTKNTANVKNRVTGPEIIDAMELEIPDILQRSLSNAWMLGVHTDFEGEKDVFAIMTNNLFQNAFSGMLQWENVMSDDLKQYLIPIIQKKATNLATTSSDTSSSTESVRKNFTVRGNFEDRIIRNKDVRAFRNSNGDILFIYSFIDNQRLIITSKESTLDEILYRVEKESFVR